MVKRNLYHAIYLQLAIRTKYLFLHWFGLKLILFGHSCRPSKYRETKNNTPLPSYDFITSVGMGICSIIVGFMRDTKMQYLYYIAGKLGGLYFLNCIWTFFHNRLLRQLEKAGTISNQKIAIPEWDWKDKDNTPEMFYKKFVHSKHPVILRGFMKDTELLIKLNYDVIMKKWSKEDVILTKPELDGFPGKLEEVDKPGYYLHNSEVLFNKYP